jgi:hypothetical protein
VRPLAALLAVAALSACGSTVPLSQQQAALNATTGDLGTATGTTGTTTGTTGAQQVGSTGATGTTSGATGSTGSSTGALPVGGTSTSGTAGTTGAVTGLTDTTISVGFIYTEGRQQAAAALGAAGVTSGDERAQWELLIKVVNDSGGLGGRQIKPVWFAQGSNSGQSISTVEAAACQHFTQDNHVALALSSFEFTNGFVDCMSKRGVPTSYSLESINSSATYRQYPLQIEPTNMALDRQGTLLAASLVRQDYFTAGTLGAAVNGVIAYDTPAYHAGVDALEKTLKAKGIALRDKRYIPFPNESADTGRLAAAISGAELAFASERIDHVMLFDLNGLLSFLFMTNAQSQQYHPRYGVTSQSSGTHLADLLGGNANAQLKDSVGVGWIPVLDLAMAEYGETKGSAARKRCRQIMLKGGQQQGLSSPGAELVATGQCDDIFTFQAAFTKLTGPVTGAAIRSALKAIGAGFAPASTFSLDFGTGRSDGVSAVKDMAYLTDCSCFRYTSGLHPVT